MTPELLAKLIASCPFQLYPREKGVELITAPARVTFLQVDKAKPNPKNPAKVEYVAHLVFPAAVDMSIADKLVKDTAVAHFGADVLGKMVPVTAGGAPVMDPNTGKPMMVSFASKLRRPIRPNSDQKGKPGIPDDGSGWFIRASANERFPSKDGKPGELAPKPRILNAYKAVMPNDSPELYSGMWVRAVLRPYAYPAKGSNLNGEVIAGVGLGLVALQKIADDDKISGGSGGSRDDAFGIIEHGVAPSTDAGAAPADALSAAGIAW